MRLQILKIKKSRFIYTSDPSYSSQSLTGIDLSPAMLKRAEKRAKDARCEVTLKQDDATLLSSIPSNHLKISSTTFLKDDVYLLISGVCKKDEAKSSRP